MMKQLGQKHRLRTRQIDSIKKHFTGLQLRIAKMGRYTIQDFIQQTAQRDLNQGEFELENERMLEINLQGMIWTKTGSMVAYRGNIKFTREGILDRGIGNLLKKAVSGEGTRLTKAEGQGKLYLADSGKKISVLKLQEEQIFVNGNDVLALDDTLKFDIRMMKKVSAMLSGGLFNLEIRGTGMLAITTHYDPLTLVVTPDNPVVTDPNATVAWSGSLQPEFRTDVSLKTFFGRGSGESLQMVFRGNGFVVIQPYEEVYMQHVS
jgi:uncharacterized protein (AIM24 family)